MHSRPLHLAILFHMHQPWYITPESTASGQYHALLPWVRLHGASGYLDVADALWRAPGARLCVNFVPSLLVQLEAVVKGARDSYLDLCERPSTDLDEDARVFLLSRFFSINWSRAVETRPRYRELLDKRGRHTTAAELRRRAERFTPEELRDLTVLFHLGWLGKSAREGDEVIAALERRGGGFSLDDLHRVVDRGRAACARVLPRYRQLSERGQVELVCSAYYHPIVPLLCDSDVAREPTPDATLPPRFAFPDDATVQIRRGREAFARIFGAPATGMWPPEGSISPAAVRAYAEQGTPFLISDEGNLWRSLGAVDRRALLRAHTYEDVAIFFRERDLSDRIGFRYAQDDAKGAVHDLLHSAAKVAAGALAGCEATGEAPILTLALDGENPWQSYPDHGAPFLDALFSALASRPVLEGYALRSVTFGEHLREVPSHHLPRLAAGSWIDSDFHIWIGDPVKNRAWTQLGQARRDLEVLLRERPGDGDLARAREFLLIAEGSDWFWWFGEPFHSNEDGLYDGLFRAYLRAAYAAMALPPPAVLLDPVDDRAGAGGDEDGHGPRRLISPRIDGRRTSYYEWNGAGVFRVPRGAAMADRPELCAIHFGFDRDHLYLRVDPTDPKILREGEIALELRSQGGPVCQVSWTSGQEHVLLQLPDGADGFREGRATGAAGADEILELAIPLGALPVTKGAALSLVVRLLSGGRPRARYPRDGAIGLTLPDPSFEATHWSG